MALIVSENKYSALQRLSNDQDIIAALAIDQRGSLKKCLPLKAVSQQLRMMLLTLKRLFLKN
ncbi:hypothetical protein AWA1501_28690 [Lactiplantibacillus pentosus]|nr:hypothetical protein AWA1501_28690 [Lactiplantibacillus pentosus]